MVMKLDQLVNGAINVGFGAAAVAVEGSKKVLDDLSTKGEQVRKDTATPDIARSVSDMFEQAGGTISDLTERLGMQGETAAQRVLDELILARVRVTMRRIPKRPSSSADGRFHHRLQQSRSLG